MKPIHILEELGFVEIQSPELVSTILRRMEQEVHLINFISSRSLTTFDTTEFKDLVSWIRSTANLSTVLYVTLDETLTLNINIIVHRLIRRFITEASAEGVFDAVFSVPDHFIDYLQEEIMLGVDRHLSLRRPRPTKNVDDWLEKEKSKFLKAVDEKIKLRRHRSLIDFFTRLGYEVFDHTMRPFHSATFSGKGVAGGWAIENEAEDCHHSINGRLLFDNLQNFNKWYQCIFNQPLPTTKEDFDFVKKKLSEFASPDWAMFSKGTSL